VDLIDLAASAETPQGLRAARAARFLRARGRLSRAGQGREELLLQALLLAVAEALGETARRKQGGRTRRRLRKAGQHRSAAVQLALPLLHRSAPAQLALPLLPGAA
jgi:hypothetical protein